MQHKALGHYLRYGCGLVALGFATRGGAQSLQDSLQTTDSLSERTIESLLTDDSTFTLADTLVASNGIWETWLIPAAVIIFSSTVVYLLYSVRSK
ncbi:MAG: hypothetical protein ACOZB3_02305 [Calditrichota bacterium]